MFIWIMMIIGVIYIVPYLLDKGEHPPTLQDQQNYTLKPQQ